MIAPDPALPGSIDKAVAVLLASDNSLRFLGLQVRSAGHGEAVVELVVQPEMANGHGIVQGGLVFALADTAFICACVDGEQPVVTASADIVFAAAGHVGDTLTARAQVRTVYGRNTICDVSVWAGDAIIAEFRGIAKRLTVNGQRP